MTKQEIETYKAEFISLLKSTGREGVDDLIEMLDEGMKPELEGQLNRDSIIIATLLHDICKADIYHPTLKKRKGDDGLWREVPSYDINYSNFPMGHGEKSAMLALMSGLEIYDDELLAIRWHMTAWDLPMQSYELNRCLNTARDEHPLCSLVQLADGIAANLLEGGGEE